MVLFMCCSKARLNGDEGGFAGFGGEGFRFEGFGDSGVLQGFGVNSWKQQDLWLLFFARATEPHSGFRFRLLGLDPWSCQLSA